MSPPGLRVACLCAEWCGTCRDYRATFEALAKRFAGRADFEWVDIEDESDALGDPDIETFPTLLMAEGDRAVFYGTVTPQMQSAERLIEAALAGKLGPPDPAAESLVASLRGRSRS
ncbi:MAG TPA: thioredoxin family protein [Caldimonas sp.]|nr:thioredoxin family protein [Caldimonas sp.]